MWYRRIVFSLIYVVVMLGVGWFIIHGDRAWGWNFIVPCLAGMYLLGWLIDRRDKRLLKRVDVVSDVRFECGDGVQSIDGMLDITPTRSATRGKGGKPANKSWRGN